MATRYNLNPVDPADKNRNRQERFDKFLDDPPEGLSQEIALGRMMVEEEAAQGNASNVFSGLRVTEGMIKDERAILEWQENSMGREALAAMIRTISLIVGDALNTLPCQSRDLDRCMAKIDRGVMAVLMKLERKEPLQITCESHDDHRDTDENGPRRLMRSQFCLTSSYRAAAAGDPSRVPMLPPARLTEGARCAIPSKWNGRNSGPTSISSPCDCPPSVSPTRLPG